ncbi:MAG: hypothetical protein IJ560_01530 [Alphaproteobacteria bacterium]|nr:hypothetical protein [Alphaproteobacteria bacterium]
MKNQRGDIKLTVLMILAIGMLFAIIYMLRTNTSRVGNAVGISSPTTTPIDNDAKINTSVTTLNEYSDSEFNDGLGRADKTEKYELDEIGAGLAEIVEFNRDINSDGMIDRITRRRIENGTPHFYYQYTIEIRRNASFIDITPPDMQTVEGADCALRKFRFMFQPKFSIQKIDRPMGDTWNTPTPAIQTIYKLNGEKLVESSPRDMGTVCDVGELF